MRLEPRTERLEPGLAAEADAILEASRALLVPFGALLEPAASRLGSADRCLWLAWLDETLVGVADVEQDAERCLIGQIAVAPAVRFRGVGRALVAAAAEAAHAAGAGYLEVWTLDARSEAFWASLGFDRSQGGSLQRACLDLASRPSETAATP